MDSVNNNANNLELKIHIRTQKCHEISNSYLQ
jgi:hypothetical protein